MAAEYKSWCSGDDMIAQRSFIWIDPGFKDEPDVESAKQMQDDTSIHIRDGSQPACMSSWPPPETILTPTTDDDNVAADEPNRGGNIKERRYSAVFLVDTEYYV